MSPHDRTGADNADALLKRRVMGREMAAGTKGPLDFRMGADFYHGFDGRRRKRVLVKIIGE